MSSKSEKINHQEMDSKLRNKMEVVAPKIKEDEAKKLSKGIGIYWGTFDPPTLAHQDIIEKSLDKLNLSKLFVVINDNKATGKNYKSPGIDRRLMMKSMLSTLLPDKDKSYLIIVLLQTDLFGFTYDVIKKKYLNQQVTAIAGQDSFEKSAEYCGKYNQVAVIPRSEENDKLLQQIKKFKLNNTVVLNIEQKFSHASSTQARQDIASDKNTQHILHPAVASYIQKRGFFRGSYTAIHHQAAVTIQKAWTKRQEIKKEHVQFSI